MADTPEQPSPELAPELASPGQLSKGASHAPSLAATPGALRTDGPALTNDATIIKPKPIADEAALAAASENGPTVITSPPCPPRPDGLAHLLKGQRLGVFELEDTLGVGGMGTVLRARDTSLERPVALKILPPELATNPDHVLRFHHEARSSARLDHEHIARVYAFGSDQGLHFIAYEFVEGVTLRARIEERGKLAVLEVLHLGWQLAGGLAHAHERGVVHRDIKPSNILITPSGKAKLVDMGLARSQALGVDQGLTQSGMTLGTFDYISPEQALDPRQADCRSDIYSLGCTLYHALTGSAPVPQGTALRKLQAHQQEAPLDPRDLNPEIPDAVAHLLARMMAKNPADRFRQPAELADELERLVYLLDDKTPGRSDAGARSGSIGQWRRNWSADPDERSPSPWPLLLAGALLAVGAVALAVWLNPPHFGAPWSPREPALPRPAPHAQIGADETRGASAANERLFRQAATAAELKRCVEEMSGGVIELTGLEYELESGLSLNSGAGEWVLRAARNLRPRLRLASGASPANAALSDVLISLNGARLRMEGLRLEIGGDDRSSSAFAGLVVQAGSVLCEDCEFVEALNAGGFAPLPMGLPRPESLPRRAAVRAQSVAARPSIFEFRRCIFAGGQDGLVVDPGSQVKLGDCMLGPYGRTVVVQAGAPATGETMPTEIACVQTSSVLSKAAFHIEGRRRVRLDLRESVFAPVARSTEPVTVVLLSPDAAPLELRSVANAFCQCDSLVALGAGSDQQTLVRTPNDLGLLGAQASDERSVWDNRSPWAPAVEWKKLGALEPATLRKVMGLQSTLAALRSGPVTMKGAQTVFGQPIYEGLEPLPADLISGAGSNSVERASLSSDLIVDGHGRLPGTFATVAAALASIASEEEASILLRVSGTLPVRTEELGNRRVALRASPGCSPELILHSDCRPDAEGDLPFFRLNDGILTLEQLAVRLAPVQKETPKLQSLVVLQGSGKVRLKSCQFTLQGDADSKTSLVTLTDASGAANPMRIAATAVRGQPARIEIADSFVRGRGELVDVRNGRPFILEARNCALALQGALLAIEGARRGDMEMAPEASTVSLERVTAYVTQGLVWFRATPMAMNHAPVRVEAADHCLFAAGEGQPLIRVDGPRSEQDLRRRLQWKGRRNLYGASAALLVWQPMEQGDAAQSYDATRWAELWGRDDEQPRLYRGLRFVGDMESRATFDGITPAALRPLITDAAEMDLERFGADLERVFVLTPAGVFP